MSILKSLGTWLAEHWSGAKVAEGINPYPPRIDWNRVTLTEGSIRGNMRPHPTPPSPPGRALREDEAPPLPRGNSGAQRPTRLNNDLWIAPARYGDSSTLETSTIVLDQMELEKYISGAEHILARAESRLPADKVKEYRERIKELRQKQGAFKTKPVDTTKSINFRKNY